MSDLEDIELSFHIRMSMDGKEANVKISGEQYFTNRSFIEALRTLADQIEADVEECADEVMQ